MGISSFPGLFLGSSWYWKALVFSSKGCVCVCSVAQSPLTLCDPMDCSAPGSSVHGILQARIWSGLPCPSPGDFPNPGIELPVSCVFCIAGKFFTAAPPWSLLVRIRRKLIRNFCQGSGLLGLEHFNTLYVILGVLFRDCKYYPKMSYCHTSRVH